MNIWTGLGALIRRISVWLSGILGDPEMLQRIGIWGAVVTVAVIVLGFLVPVGLLCLAYVLVSRKKETGESREQEDGTGEGRP